jgi:pyrroline-5-carboxylate reductase
MLAYVKEEAVEKRVGIIGLGSMGKMLLDGFVQTKALRQNQLSVSTKTKEKLYQAQNEFPEIKIFENNVDTAGNSDVLFICVKPSQVKEVLDEIVDSLKPNAHLVSIAGRVTINNLESKFSGKISRLIPSITSVVYEGISLACHNRKVEKEDLAFFEKIIGSISAVETIQEKDLETATELTSCGPGLVAAIFNELVDSFPKDNDISKETATRMMVSTLYGTAKLIREKQMSFSETVNRVATKGGITEEGASVLRDKLPEVFTTVFEKMLEKRERVNGTIQAMF